MCFRQGYMQTSYSLCYGIPSPSTSDVILFIPDRRVGCELVVLFQNTMLLLSLFFSRKFMVLLGFSGYVTQQHRGKPEIDYQFGYRGD